MRKWYPYHFILLNGINSDTSALAPLGNKLLSNKVGDYEAHNLFTGGVRDGAYEVARNKLWNNDRSQKVVDILKGAYDNLDPYAVYTKDVIIAHSGGGELSVGAAKLLKKKGEEKYLSEIITFGGANRYVPNNIPVFDSLDIMMRWLLTIILLTILII